jgi:hypothetical protein
MLFTLVAAVRLLVGILSTVLTPDPDAVSFSEHAGLLFAMTGTFIFCFALRDFAGYLGGIWEDICERLVVPDGLLDPAVEVGGEALGL